MPDLNKIIDDLSKLTVAEAADLAKQLEEKWGVTPMAAAAPAAAGLAVVMQQQIKMNFQLCLFLQEIKKLTLLKK